MASKLRFQRLLPKPNTLHADWRPAALSSDTATNAQMLEIVSINQGGISVCATQHRCTSCPVEADSVMLTTSACNILQVSAGDPVRLVPIILYKVLVIVDTNVPKDDSKPRAIISSSLAALLGVSSESHPDLFICPASYTSKRHNLSISVVDVKEDSQSVISIERDSQSTVNVEKGIQSVVDVKAGSQSVINVQEGSQSVVNVEKDSQSIVNAEPTEADIKLNENNQQVPLLSIWLRPEVVSTLGLKPISETFVYQSNAAFSAGSTVQVLQHPGFCYLSASQADSLDLHNGDVVELRAKKNAVSYVQVHPFLEEMRLSPDSYLDFAVADDLKLEESDHISIASLQAQLYWMTQSYMDDVRSKARNTVALQEETLARYGYFPQETVRVFHGGKQYTALIEPIAKQLKEGLLSFSPLLVRQAQLRPGQGVFLSSDHEPHIIAQVGIFNIEEVGNFAAKGSAQLAPFFKMPCQVELRNVERGTSMDILLEPDPYPRASAMIRLSRTTRQMLLLERGDKVLVKPIATSKRFKTLRTILSRIRKALVILVKPIATSKRFKTLRTILSRIRKTLYYPILLVLIQRRRILVSLAPAHTWDDQARVARIDPEALAVLGMSEGDRLHIFYRGKRISRIALPREPDYKDPIQTPGSDSAAYHSVPLQFQMGLDALGRYELAQGDLEFGTVVEVERDMGFIFKKSLNLTILPIIGTVVTTVTLAVTLFKDLPIGLLFAIGIGLALLFFYFALSVERSKVS